MCITQTFLSKNAVKLKPLDLTLRPWRPTCRINVSDISSFWEFRSKWMEIKTSPSRSYGNTDVNQNYGFETFNQSPVTVWSRLPDRIRWSWLSCSKLVESVKKTRRGTLKATWLSDSFVSQTAGHVFKATWLLVEFEFDAYSEQRSSDLLRGSSRI